MNVYEVLAKSEKRLADLHPMVRYMAQRLIMESFAAGVPIIITQGYRSIAYQNELFAQGRTKPGQIVTNARGGRSYHNYGLAVDFALLMPDGRTASWNTLRDGDNDRKADWLEVAEIGKRIGFEWGGEWKFRDMPHFQYTFGMAIGNLFKGIKPLLKPEIANKIIEVFLSPAWHKAHENGDEAGKKLAAFMADALRIASGQKPKNV